MTSRMVALTLAALALSSGVRAQDSVSRNGNAGLPGDALSPWDTSQQCADYVVDLSPFTTSWGNAFMIAPLVKASKASNQYFNNLVSAQSLSRTHALDVAWPATTYRYWTVPGQGINALQNDPAGAVTPSGPSNQFAVTFSDFGTTPNNRSYNGIVGAVVNYEPGNANRLYVHRVNAATNSNTPAEDRSQFGIGAVDAQGNILFRADGFGSPGPATITGNNVFRLDLLARTCGTLNYVDNFGLADAAAGNWIVVKNSVTYNTPNVGPESVFGVPFFLGSNFDKQYAYGPATPPSYSLTTAHRPGTADHRGALAYMSRNVPCLAGTHGTAAILGYDTQGLATMICLWGLNADASVAGTQVLALPGMVTDPITGVTSYTSAAFDHYHSQTAFRGGNAPVALNIDQQGRLLAAGVSYWVQYSGTDNPWNDVVVARVSCQDAVEWTLAGYSSDPSGATGTGKPILDGPAGDVIGRMCQLHEVTGGAPLGPSVSAPMIDSVGNVWFLSAVALYKTNSQGQPYTDYDSALLRAVYDPAVFGYRLELVFEVGDIFASVNTGLNWRLTFLNIADSNSVDSGTAWSANISELAHGGVAPAPDLPTADPTALGGLVLNAKIIYDLQGDFIFNDPTSSYYDPGQPKDEAYTVLLYVAAPQPAPPVCPGDLNCDGDINFGDINPFVLRLSNPAGYQAQYPGCPDANGDLNGDTSVGFDDINPFVALLSSGQGPCQ